MKRGISVRDLRRIAQECGVPLERVRLALALDPSVPAAERERVEACARELKYAFGARDRVAMAANTSIATVNRAYRAGARDRINPEVLARIEVAAARLGYMPDVVARGRRGRQRDIVVVCPPIEALFGPYMGVVLPTLTEALERAGMHAAIAPVPAGRPLPDLALSGVAAAVVVWGTARLESQLRALAAAGKPAVMFGPHPGVPGVTIDWELAGYEVTRVALRGEYDALHLGFAARLPWYRALQLEGMARALREHGGRWPALQVLVEPDVSLVELAGAFRERGCAGAADLVLQAGRDGRATEWRSSGGWAGRHLGFAREVVLAAERAGAGRGVRVALLGQSDFGAITVRNVLAGEHPDWEFGREVGIAGRDNLEPYIGYHEPVLTTVAYDIPGMCETVVGVLLRRVGGWEREKVVLRTWVEERRSL